MVNSSIVFNIFLLVTVHVTECGRYAGGGASIHSSRSSYNPPAIHHTSIISRPTYHVSYKPSPGFINGRGNVRRPGSVGRANPFSRIGPPPPSDSETGKTEKRIDFATNHLPPKRGFPLGKGPLGSPLDKTPQSRSSGNIGKVRPVGIAAGHETPRLSPLDKKPPPFSPGSYIRNRPPQSINTGNAPPPPINYNATGDKPLPHSNSSEEEPPPHFHYPGEKPVPQYNSTREKPVLRFNSTREKLVPYDYSAGDKSVPHYHSAGNKPVPHTNSTGEHSSGRKPLPQFNSTGEKPLFNFNSTEEKPHLNFNSRGEKPLPHFSSTRVKPLSNFNSTEEKPHLKFNSTGGKPLPHFNSTREKPLSNFNSTEEKPNLNFNSTGEKPLPHFNSTGEKPLSNFNSTEEKPHFNFNSTGEKPLPHFNSTGENRLTNFKSTEEKPHLNFNSTGEKPLPHFNSTGEKLLPHYNSAIDESPLSYSPVGLPQSPTAYGPSLPYTPGNYHHQVGSHSQGSGVTVINNNINNHYGGDYRGQTAYTTHDTGKTALGLFLGHSLAKVTTPSFHHHNSYYDGHGYASRYDHYTVHHYYHNRDTVKTESTIEPNAIVACAGDSGTFCPANTTSLCTNNGTVMCVTSATSTVPCNNEGQTSCVRSSVPCKDNNSTECKQSSGDAVSMTIPYISTAKVYGSVSFVNNSIVVSNATASNIDTITNNSNTAAVMNATKAEGGPPQEFCVTIVAVPTERQLTEGEKLFSEAEEVFSLFAVYALGLN